MSALDTAADLGCGMETTALFPPCKAFFPSGATLTTTTTPHVIAYYEERTFTEGMSA